MNFSIHQESRLGTRSNNEDSLGHARTGEALLMVVADGMGGHQHGEVASRIAVQFLLDAFRRDAKPVVADPGRFLQRAIVQAHEAIVDHALQKRLAETPKTTCVACVVQGSEARWAHVGDSRLYHVRAGRVQSRTRDHSRVQQLVDAGRIREEAIPAHPERSLILNCLGSEDLPQVEVSGIHPLLPGDALLLCSDGLWGPLPGAAFAHAFLNKDVGAAVPALLDAAQARAGRDCDNLSAVAITWLDGAGASPSQASTR